MNTRWIAPALTAMLTPALALAHPGHGADNGFLAGALHPLAGVDHLVAMLAVGLWAAQLGARQRWAVPASFMLLMLAGVGAGLVGLPVTIAEQGIAASLLVLGLLVARATLLPAGACQLLAGGFAFFHGFAHGAEAQASTVGTFLAGLLITTASLHVAGIRLGLWLQQRGAAALTRWIGSATALLGVALLVS